MPPLFMARKSSGDFVGLIIGALLGLVAGWIIRWLMYIIDSIVVIVALAYGAYWGWKHLEYRRGKLIRK